MSTEEKAAHDPMLRVLLHESSADLLVALARAMEALTDLESGSLPEGARNYLLQALDCAADLDLFFGVLADELEAAVRAARSS